MMRSFVICTAHRIFLGGDQIKEDELGGADMPHGGGTTEVPAEFY
jgi:hypothetical protein